MYKCQDSRLQEIKSSQEKICFALECIAKKFSAKKYFSVKWKIWKLPLSSEPKPESEHDKSFFYLLQIIKQYDVRHFCAENYQISCKGYWMLMLTWEVSHFLKVSLISQNTKVLLVLLELKWKLICVTIVSIRAIWPIVASTRNSIFQINQKPLDWGPDFPLVQSAN